MKLFGTAFFSLAVFSLWSATASAQESVGTATTSTATQAPSEQAQLQPTISTASTSTVSSLGSTSISSSKENKTSQTTSTPVEILSTTNNSSSTTGTTHSLPPSNETAASELTPTAIGPDITTTGNVTGNQTLPESKSQNTTQSEPDSTGSDSGKTKQVLDSSSYINILLPVIIALIVITLSVCILVALYRICWKTTPERQENETEHTSLDKENVKLISVKTTSPESGEHSSQGKNKTRQHDDSSHLGNKCV
ncbi:PREDICTED: endomucin isoform X1 [Gekko japonicus]|uniref:Endomucin isoform X1 n=1 Tax=Gekko japonicus TaxID=146911 RepID=A0ABM1KCN1_GEKJA|nr:PREDICTED: endomucin isoform X1 [Gekko japonicus]